MYGHFACICVCAPLTCLVPAEPEERVGSPGSRCYKLPCGCQEKMLGPGEEQCVLSITELYLSPMEHFPHQCRRAQPTMAWVIKERQLNMRLGIS